MWTSKMQRVDACWIWVSSQAPGSASSDEPQWETLRSTNFGATNCVYAKRIRVMSESKKRYPRSNPIKQFGNAWVILS